MLVEQLRRAIAESGQTEYAIAKGSGVSQSVVNRFVHGERGISFETAAKLCAHLRPSGAIPRDGCRVRCGIMSANPRDLYEIHSRRRSSA